MQYSIPLTDRPVTITMEPMTQTLPEIIYQDMHLLVINKPAGLLSIPDGYQPDLPHVVQVLKPAWGPLWVVHRLDRDTSGVLLLARSAEMHRLLNLQFEDRRIQKTYRAVVFGVPRWKQITCDLPLRVNGDRRHRTVVDQTGGKPACTDFMRLHIFRDASLIEARPHTGYTHQIRAHLSNLGFPLLGDPLYRFPKGIPEPDHPYLFLPPIQRTALHALRVELEHPITHQPLKFEAPIPTDFSTLLETLRTGSQTEITFYTE